MRGLGRTAAAISRALPRGVRALDELGGKQHLAEDTEIELTSLGLADDNVAAAKRKRSTRWQPPAGAIDSEHAVYLAGPGPLARDGGHNELLDEFTTDLFPDGMDDIALSR